MVRIALEICERNKAMGQVSHSQLKPKTIQAFRKLLDSIQMQKGITPFLAILAEDGLEWLTFAEFMLPQYCGSDGRAIFGSQQNIEATERPNCLLSILNLIVGGLKEVAKLESSDTN